MTLFVHALCATNEHITHTTRFAEEAAERARSVEIPGYVNELKGYLVVLNEPHEPIRAIQLLHRIKLLKLVGDEFDGMISEIILLISSSVTPPPPPPPPLLLHL
jgi:hypothetical protein